MEDLFFSTEVGSRTVCLSPVTRNAYRAAGAKGLGGDYGYFIYEYETANRNAGIEILAKAASVDAAMRLFTLLTSRPQVAA